MKTYLITGVFLITFIVAGSSQAMRYFTIALPDSYDTWQDTLYIVSTNDALIIDEAIAELVLPIEERKHINGILPLEVEVFLNGLFLKQ